MRGELEVRVRGVQEGTWAIYSLGRQIVWAAIAIASAAFALQLHFHEEDRLARWPLGVGGFAALMFVFSSLLGRPKRK